MVTRTPEEILQDITRLFKELTEAQEYERTCALDRMDYLEYELNKQKQKQKDIASILLKE